MKRLLAGAAALSLAAMLSAAPQTSQPETSQPAQTTAKPGGKHKKHRGTGDATPNRTRVRKGNRTQNTPAVKPGH